MPCPISKQLAEITSESSAAKAALSVRHNNGAVYRTRLSLRVVNGGRDRITANPPNTINFFGYGQSRMALIRPDFRTAHRRLRFQTQIAGTRAEQFGGLPSDFRLLPEGHLRLRE